MVFKDRIWILGGTENYYFGDKPEATAAMDALLATRGYRRFEWRQVLPAQGSQP